MASVPDEQSQRLRSRCKERRRGRKHQSIVRASQAASGQDSEILRTLEPLSWLRRSERALLQHFVAEAASMAIASRHGHGDFCRNIIPLALQSPSLLYATLAYSAAHQHSLRPSPNAVVDPAIHRYVCSSLSAVQAELLRPSSNSKTILLAASLMLCLVGLSTGDSQSRSWRVHAEGAKALLASVHRSQHLGSSTNGSDLDTILTFLSRWYLNIESLTALTSSGLVTGQCVVQDTTLGIITEPEQSILNVCDDHFGYPTRLAMLFREIGASAWERRRQLKHSSPELSQEDFNLDAENLHSSLDEIEAEVLHSPDGPAFYPGVREALTENDVRDFTACTEAYVEMARVLIERRVRGSQLNSEAVRAPIRKIIAAVQSITPVHGNSPSVAIGPPLFTAGCEALDPVDRLAVRETFVRFSPSAKSGNMDQALNMLECLWADGGPEPDWLAYQEARDLDFLPY